MSRGVHDRGQKRNSPIQPGPIYRQRFDQHGSFDWRLLIQRTRRLILSPAAVSRQVTKIEPVWSKKSADVRIPCISADDQGL